KAIDDLSEDDVECVTLMVSELASNSIRHAGSPFELAVTRDDAAVRVEITDDGAGRPEVRHAAPSATSGRGLHIVDLLADDWGVDDLDEDGKTVWFTYTATGT
ncbi:MAG TPA: ATP-binding protein, partial [Aquihabitans sp.]|nr:ATP-binding protein [Aquihabitans sp.]